jgi:hypothetical protein
MLSRAATSFDTIMAKIFICYRRTDSKGHTGWLHDRLATRFGNSRIYRDIDSIPAGADFVEEVQKALSRCAAVIVVIGPRWLSEENSVRLKTSHDLVRQEIAQALKLKLKVYPVLVDGAQMPPSSALPRDIKSLARLHAIELRDVSFPVDVQLLIKNLEKLDGLKPAGSKPGRAPATSKPAQPPKTVPAGSRGVKRSTQPGTRKATRESGGEPTPVVKKASGTPSGPASRAEKSAKPARAKPNPRTQGTAKQGENSTAQPARKKRSPSRGAAAKSAGKVAGGGVGSAARPVQPGSSTKQAATQRPGGKAPAPRRKRRSGS